MRYPAINNNLVTVLHHAGVVALSWGPLPSGRIKHSSNAIRDPLSRIMRAQTCESFYQYDAELFMRFQPAPAVGNELMMAIYESSSKYEQERRLIGKPAKLLKRIIPTATVAQCQDFACWWSENFGLSERAFTFEYSSDESDFVAAYKGAQSKTFDPLLSDRDGFEFKSLQMSCMRHGFDHLPKHPAAAYASGDFKILICRDDKGYIAARSVVCVNNADGACAFAGPVYTTSDHASKLMVEYLNSNGIKAQQDYNWHGAKLQRIEYEGGFILPYLDSDRDLSDKDSYLVVDRRGDICASETNGTVDSEPQAQCEECGERYDCEESGGYIETESIAVCDCCLNEVFTYCDYSGEYYRDSDGVQVYYLSSQGWVRSETVSESCASESGDYIYTHDGDCWSSSDCVMIESEEEYYPRNSDEIFQSHHDDEFYLISDRVTFGGQAYTTAQAIDLALEIDTDTTTTEESALTTILESVAEIEGISIIHIDSFFELPTAKDIVA